MKTKMIATLLPLLFLLGVLAMASPVLAQTVTIDFDELNDKTVVTTQYPGLTFSSPGSALGVQVAMYCAIDPIDCSLMNPPHSGTNGIIQLESGIIRIDFDFCVARVGAWFSTSAGTTVTLTAYDALDNPIDSTTVVSELFTYAYAEVHGDNISYVIFNDSGNFWVMDDLEYDHCPIGAPLFSDILAILPLGIIAGIVGIKRRRKTND